MTGSRSVGVAQSTPEFKGRRDAAGQAGTGVVHTNARAGRSNVRRVARRDVLRQGHRKPLPVGKPDAYRSRRPEGSDEHRGADRGPVVPGGGFEHRGTGPGGNPHRMSDPRFSAAVPDLPRRPFLVPQHQVSVAGRVWAHRRVGGTVARSATPERAPSKLQPTARFLAFIDGGLDGSLRIAVAAEHASVSEDTLGRFVFEVFPVTPKQFLMNRRISKACQLLEETVVTISDVAAACGYSDHSAFSRRFRSATHLTPLQYRASQKPPDARRGQHGVPALRRPLRSAGSPGALAGAALLHVCRKPHSGAPCGPAAPDLPGAEFRP